jgi:oligopeptide/dipeptide ABC transporter ATP-binding protein
MSDMETARPVVAVHNLVKHYQHSSGWLVRRKVAVRAVDGVSFAIAPGETLGLVGESGCGKSTLGKTILRLLPPSAGHIELHGTDITRLREPALRPLRRRMQMIFQDPYSSLNPRQTAGQIVAEPLATHGVARGAEKWQRVAALLQRVGIQPEQMDELPHQFSGGQRQRIAIARALAASPDLIVCDEPVSALDVSIRAQVINLLMDLQDEFGLAYLFVAHDLAVVQHISHRVAVMYLGRIVELADTADLFAHPLHPYTQALLAAVPVPDPARRNAARVVVGGDLPSPLSPPAGCPFHPRCPQAMVRCRESAPALLQDAPGHWSACHLHRGG